MLFLDCRLHRIIATRSFYSDLCLAVNNCATKWSSDNKSPYMLVAAQPNECHSTNNLSALQVIHHTITTVSTCKTCNKQDKQTNKDSYTFWTTSIMLRHVWQQGQEHPRLSLHWKDKQGSNCFFCARELRKVKSNVVLSDLNLMHQLQHIILCTVPAWNKLAVIGWTPPSSIAWTIAQIVFWLHRVRTVVSLSSLSQALSSKNSWAAGDCNAAVSISNLSSDIMLPSSS